jgi:Inner membrane protein YgaP-like, transmembrane domain
MHFIIRRIAGTFVLASLALGYWVSPYWYLFTAFVGLNLMQSSFTRWCLMEQMLEKAGVGRKSADDARPVGAGSGRVSARARAPTGRAAGAGAS